MFRNIYFIHLSLFCCVGLILIVGSPQGWAQQGVADYTALGDASYAQTLGLSDEQIAAIARILDERRNAIVTAKPEDRPATLVAANEKLAALLTPQQKQAFAELVAGGKLRFRFQSEPWSNVLQWFASQADLALVMNEVPAGQFTYSDAKNHTPTQAIDLLNSVLQSKGFTLIRREKMLIVAQLTQGLPYDQLPKVTPEELVDRGRFEYVSVLFPLEGRPVEQVSQEVTAFLGPNARATPLPTTGQLMVVDTAGRVDAIRKLIASIPVPKKPEQPKPKEQQKPKPPAPVFQVHLARGLNIGSAVETLEKLYGDAKFTGDAKVEQITAFTVPTRQQAIAQTLAQMTENITGDNEPRLEIYQVVDSDLGELVDVLAQANPGVQVSADTVGQRLLVVGTAKQQDDVVRTLEKLDAVEAAASAAGVAVFEVDTVLAPKIVELLQPLIPRAKIVQNDAHIAVSGSTTDQQIASAAIEQLELAEGAAEKPLLRFYRLARPLEAPYLDSVRQLAPKAKISNVPQRNQLAIVSTEADYELLVEAISKMEAELGDPEPAELQQLDVTVDDANRLLAMMRSSFPKEQMLLNQQKNKLLVWTTSQSDARIKERYAELHAMLPAKRVEVWKSYSTKVLSADNLQTLLRGVVDGAEFKPDPPRDRMMILATTGEHVRIQETLAAFQGEDINPVDYEDVLLAYPINRGDAVAVVEMLTGMYPSLKFSPDVRTNKILVTAPLADQKRVQAVLEQLDTPPGDTGEVPRTYTVKSLAPSTVVQLLSPLFPRLQMTPQDSQHRIAVIGTSHDHQQFKTSVEQLDQNDARGSVVAYDVGDESPMAVRSVLQQLVPSAIVSASSRGDSVVVWADEEDHAKVKQAVEQYTKDPAEKRTTKVYRLQYADPDSAEYILRDLIRSARFIEDDRTGTVTATATEAEHEQIASVIQQMDVMGNDRRSTEVYRFDRTDARSAERTFERLVPRARVSSIYGTNAIVVSASEAEHALLREVAEKLNGGNTKSVTKVYPLDQERINVDDVLDSIDDALRSRVAIRMNEQTNSLIVRGSAEDQAAVKQLVDELLAQVPAKAKPVATVYRLQHSDPEVVADVMRDLLDDARFRADEQTGTLTATALPEEHEEISKVLKQLDIPNQERQQVTEIYRFDRIDADSAVQTFQRLIPRARVSSIRGTNSIVVTATTAEHQVFRESADKLNSAGNQTVTKVYHLDSFPASRMDNIAEDLIPGGEVTYDSEANVLLVSGTEEDHQRVQDAVEAMNQASESTAVERVYTLRSANPANIQGALERLMPKARVASDLESRSIIVSADEADQQRMQALIAQLDAVPGQEAVMRAYVVRHADSKQTFASLQNTFSGNGDFSLSFQEASKTIFVVATPKNHEIFGNLLSQLDTPVLAPSDRTAKTYLLPNMSGNAARTTITALLQGTSPAATVEVDEFKNQLVVVGTDEQHRKVATTLGQMTTEDADFEVFDLAYVDPWTVESAVESLFANQPASAAPSITSDYFSQRLFVRGSSKQIEQVRTLLGKMGERVASSNSADKGGDVRTIHFRGDVKAAIRQIEDIWPRFRKNRIQVIAPSDPNFKIERTQTLDLDDESDDEDSVSRPVAQLQSKYVAVQETTRAPEPDSTLPETDAINEPTNQVSPIVIVPEVDRITIASSDHEALDQLEELLNALSRSESSLDSGMGGDFAVYLLRNTGASSMRELLANLFEQLRETGGGAASSRGPNGPTTGYGGLFGPMFGSVAVVADDRLNALIIHGDRKERELIKELLTVLDSEDLPNPIVVYQPELVRLQHTQAQRVLAILKNVYRSQLTSGGGRKKVEIPEGVSSAVASVLQQINAAAGAPILTLDVDETTNSIIMRAPPELRKEIKVFVESLDTSAGSNRSRNVRVVQLRNGKSDQIRDALQQFLLKSSARE